MMTDRGWIDPFEAAGQHSPFRKKRFCKFCGGRLVPDPSSPMYDEYTGQKVEPPKVCRNAACNRGVTF